MITWIIVAHRSGARIVDASKPSQGIRVIHKIAYPFGRLRNRELTTDKPGRMFNNGGSVNARHGFDPFQDTHDHVADIFAKEIGEFIHHSLNQKQCHQFAIVADPKLLGKIRTVLSPSAQKALVSSQAKDLAWVEDNDLADHLEDIVQKTATHAVFEDSLKATSNSVPRRLLG